MWVCIWDWCVCEQSTTCRLYKYDEVCELIDSALTFCKCKMTEMVLRYHFILAYITKFISTLPKIFNIGISCTENRWALHMMTIKFVWQSRIFLRVKWTSGINQHLSLGPLFQIDTLLVLIGKYIMSCHEVGRL